MEPKDRPGDPVTRSAMTEAAETIFYFSSISIGGGAGVFIHSLMSGGPRSEHYGLGLVFGIIFFSSMIVSGAAYAFPPRSR